MLLFRVMKILCEAAETAVHDYETDRDLTDFEAFGEGDLYDEYEYNLR